MARQVTAGHEALRASEHGSFDDPFTHDVVAVDADGNVLFETESARSEQAAREQAVLCDEAEAEDPIEGVDHYEVRARDD